MQIHTQQTKQNVERGKKAAHISNTFLLAYAQPAKHSVPFFFGMCTVVHGAFGSLFACVAQIPILVIY